jgi:MFS family permease
MIIPLQRAFGWDVATISGAISLNIILLGTTGPLLTGLIDVVGLKRTILDCMVMLIAGTGLSNLMTAPWQLFLTWGLMVGIGSGAGAMGMAAAVANRWFAKRNGLAIGLLTAANAAGQLIFLPLLTILAQRYGGLYAVEDDRRGLCRAGQRLVAKTPLELGHEVTQLIVR